MKKNIYEVEKNIERILKGNSTGFLLPDVVKEIRRKLRKSDYKVFAPYTDSEKVILYHEKEPKIRLYKIKCYDKDIITHSAIMGSLFGLNIISEMFGDIILYNGNFYFYILDTIHDFIENQFMMVGNIPISLEEMPYDYLSNFEREYKEIELIVPSLRIDAVIARLIGINREKVQDNIKEKLVLLNGEVLNKSSYFLKDGDIFSIRKFGKYKYMGIIKTTKKDNYLIKVDKYV